MDAPRAGATQCVGCHVLSRDGHRIAVGMDIPAPSPYKVFDVATRSMIYQQGTQFGGGSNFFSFSPDAMQVLTSSGANISWRDAQTGTALMDPLVPLGAMPDWSPDGTRMVYAKPQSSPPCPTPMFCGQPGVDAAGLEVMPFNGTTWGASAPLVPYSGQNNYYPTFSPDGGWVLFNRSPSNHNSYDAPDAQVWVVGQAGGAPVQLAKASTGGDSWPKWAPIVQMWQGRPILWFTFSSRRAYGLRIANGAHAQVWMAAFDPSQSADPSLPAFWLPFQEDTSGNHIAQWVLNVDRMGCTIDSQCATNEFCVGGHCLPRPM
jgi:WD40-like Beta Propeller Repeat